MAAKRQGHKLLNVLNTGTDKTLAEARAAALQQAGHAVVTATNEIDLLDACKRTRFDVVVIGQGLATMPKHHVLSLVQKRCPKAQVLELYTARSAEVLKNADDWLQVPDDSVDGELVERVTALSQRRLRGRRRA